MNRKKDFWGYILDIAQKTDSLFVMNNSDRANLFDFFDINEWFGTGLNPDQKDFINGRIRIEADDMIVRCIEERLRLWMSAYKRSNEEKYSLLLGYARDLWPVTADAYDRMIRSRKSSDKAEAWQLLDFFLCELTKELDQYRADEIENLVAKAAGVLTTEQENLFSVFWSTMIMRSHSGSNPTGNPVSRRKHIQKVHFQRWPILFSILLPGKRIISWRKPAVTGDMRTSGHLYPCISFAD